MRERGDDVFFSFVFVFLDREQLLLLGLLELLLGHTGKPVDEQRSSDVEDDVDPHQAKVPPSLRVVATDSSQVGVGLGHAAVDALISRIRVGEVTLGGVDECLEILDASLIRRWLDFDKLVVGTDDVCIRDTDR